jgi:hypothetical protein
MLLLANRIGFHNEATKFIQILRLGEAELMNMILARE